MDLRIAAGVLLSLAAAGRCADLATIIDSGSTNTAGFRIEVPRAGEAVCTATPRRAGQLSGTKPGKRVVPAALAKRFYGDLEARESLSNLPSRGCMKSASFGTTLVIEYRGKQTPDLRCGDHGNATLKALIQDSDEIIKLFATQESLQLQPSNENKIKIK